jgi:hypothetical protein
MSAPDMPPLTQQPIIHVDGTPDAEYPLRILRAYRENCNCRFVDSAEGKETVNPLIRMMNEHCERRAAILDEAIRVLEGAKQ